VNVQEINQLLNKHFIIQGKVVIDPESGVVDVTGTVEAKEDSLTHIPVQFGRVMDFNLRRQPRLTSLVGSPVHVSGEYKVKSNAITDCEGAPVHVGYHCWISGENLISLAHLPMQGARSFTIFWTPRIRLLRLLDARSVRWGNYVGYDQQVQTVREIMNKYVGKGKTHMLNCALELKKAGFVENASW
jgi:hypothetical protein